jgi:alkylation response protein AidB-like acyl-CoA dehydrogenase
MSGKLWTDMVRPEFLAGLRRAVQLHVAPEADQIDRDDVYPVQSIKALARLGYTSMTLPASYGGQTTSFADCAAVFEEVSYASAAVGISLITILQAQTIIHLFGDDSLKRTVLPEFSEGLITSFALTEANHGSDIRSLDTKAARRGDR